MALTAADLIAQQTPTEHEHEIALASGAVLRFKNVQDTRELAQIKKKAERLLNMKAGQVPDAWKPYMPIDEATANIVAHLTSLMLDPVFDDLTALRACRETGMFAAFLDQQIMMRMGARIVAAEDDAVADEKNASAPTSGGETTLSSAETSTTNTPTSSVTLNGDTPASSLPSA